VDKPDWRVIGGKGGRTAGSVHTPENVKNLGNTGPRGVVHGSHRLTATTITLMYIKTNASLGDGTVDDE
jgi:hypothetical protein